MRLRSLALIATALVSTAALAAPLSGSTCAGTYGHCSHRHLNGGKFENLDLSHSRWVGASLVHASFRSSSLAGATFRKANLRFANLSMGDRTSGNYSNANMFGANMIHSTFVGSRMRYANMEYAHLNGTTMDRTDLTGADLRHADLRDSSFYGARLCHTIQPNGLENNQNCTKGGGAVHASGVSLPQNIPTRGGPLVGKGGN
jgi:uncharacterized protein YjbI with pentapeptide repeats